MTAEKTVIKECAVSRMGTGRHPWCGSVSPSFVPLIIHIVVSGMKVAKFEIKMILALFSAC